MVSVVSRQSRAAIKDGVVEKLKQRIRNKRSPMTLPFELEYRHVYVLPTTFGWGFGFMLVFMALGGLNFNNNMALMLVFLLGTIAQLTTLVAYRNLSGLKINNISSEPVFCGEAAEFRVFVTNNDERRRFAIQAGFKKPQDCKDFNLNGNESYLLKQATVKRGWLALDSVRLETRFPLGLFKAWSWVFPDNRCLVYPTPAHNAPPLPKTGHGISGLAKRGDGDDVYGLRKYQAGDSMQRVAWRASARQDELYSLEMEAPQEEACELDWDQLTGAGTESRLSILTAWVIAAEFENLSYSLKLPGFVVSTGKGPEHQARCLQHLALYGL